MLACEGGDGSKQKPDGPNTDEQPNPDQPDSDNPTATRPRPGDSRQRRAEPVHVCCLWHWVLLLLPSYTGWSLLFLALASLIYLPKEPAGAAVRAPSALDVPADCLLLVNSAYHSVFTFLVRVERIYSDSWLSSSLAAKLLRGVTRPSADVYSYCTVTRRRIKKWES